MRLGSGERAHLLRLAGIQPRTVVLPIPDDDQWIVSITTDPGSHAARALRHLAVAA
jgi:hypothetical protein